MVVTESEIREYLRDLLAGIGRDPWRHGLDLAFHIGDARLEDVAVEFRRRDMVTLADDEVRQLRFARSRGRADHHM